MPLKKSALKVCPLDDLNQKDKGIYIGGELKKNIGIYFRPPSDYDSMKKLYCRRYCCKCT